jgi:signal transduction histidine kinase
MTTPTTTGQLRDLEGRHKLLLRLVEQSVILNSTLELDSLLQLITATATELLGCEAASILLLDEKNPRLFFAAATGSDPEKLAEIPVPIGGSLAGTIFRTNQPMILNDVNEDPRHYSIVADHIKFKVKSLLGVPMPIKDRPMGVLEAVNKRDGDFTESDVTVLSVIAAHAALAINNARLFKSTQQALARVKETNQIKNRFLELASHEMRGPLSVIIEYATFLQRDAKDRFSSHVDRVANAATKVRSLLDQMNNLTLLQAYEMEMDQKKIPIQGVLEAALDEIKYFAAKQDLQLVYAFQEDPIYVNLDFEKTTLAFVNLLNNAIRFSAEGNEIVVGATQQDDQILAWVQDKGAGIPVDQLQKIFEEFYQIGQTDHPRHSGLGIGLTIAKGLIEAQGGEIWAESEGRGQGATFKVILPAA